MEEEIAEVKRVYGHLTMFKYLRYINYRLVNARQERKASADKNVLVCIY